MDGEPIGEPIALHGLVVQWAALVTANGLRPICIVVKEQDGTVSVIGPDETTDPNVATAVITKALKDALLNMDKPMKLLSQDGLTDPRPQG